METLKVSLIFFLVLKLNSAEEECHVYENHCLFIDSSNPEANYYLRQSNCEKYGGILVSITNAQKNDFILKNILINVPSNGYLASPTVFWFGLKREYMSSTWHHSDGSELSSSGFKNWNTDYDPDYNKGFDCAVINSETGLWHRMNCQFKMGAICETPLRDCNVSGISIRNAQFDKCDEDTSVKAGTNISVTCNHGYVLHGPESVTCTGTGWSDWSEMPTCEPGCLPPELSVGLKIFNNKDEYKTGEELMIYCGHGYLLGETDLKTYKIVKCDSDGNWPILKYSCISDQQLKCQDHVCNEISVTANVNSTVMLECPLDENGTNYSHYHGFWNHEPILMSDKNYLINKTSLTIPHFEPNSIGTYSCIRGHNETNIEKITIYIVNIEKSCPQSVVHNLPAIKVNESESIYLYSSTAGVIHEIKWFKDGKRLTANRNRSILPNGDVLIKNATVNDQGLYKFEVENKLPNCFDQYSTSVYVKATTESYCGLTDDEHNQPWLVSLFSKDETTPFCYGTLINEQWIISSAACLSRFYRAKTTNVTAKFQQHPDNSTQAIQIEQFIVHPQYSRRFSINDIGLLKLKELVTFSDTLKPICLSSRDFQKEHDSLCEKGLFRGILCGWGSLEALTKDDFGPVRTDNLIVAAKETCQQFVAFDFPEKMFCATHDESDKGPTKLVEDSGSPFLVRENGQYYLQGVLCWGERMAQTGNYDYFTKVVPYYDWIKSRME